jgi:ribosome biogenesis GTPase
MVVPVTQARAWAVLTNYEAMAGLMPDIKAHAGHCKFYNCSHLHEPGCGVLLHRQTAASAGGISDNRYKIYSDLFAELSQTRY